MDSSSTSASFNVKFLPENIIFDSQISSGRTMVMKVTTNGLPVVMKVFPHSNSSKLKYFENEAKIGTSLNHPNILSFVNVSTHSGKDNNSDYSYILSPFYKNGTLFDMFYGGIRLDEKALRTYFHQLVKGIEHMHSKGIYHLDLKLCNILVDDDYQLKIFDFDLSYTNGDKSILSRGSPNYRAPELKKDSANDLEKCDVYSLGVILFTMHNGCREPFIEPECGHDENRIKFDISPVLFWTSIKKFLNNHEVDVKWSQDFKKLFEKMVMSSPKDRCSIQEIKQSDWYNGEVLSQEEMKNVMENKYNLFD